MSQDVIDSLSTDLALACDRIEADARVISDLRAELREAEALALFQRSCEWRSRVSHPRPTHRRHPMSDIDEAVRLARTVVADTNDDRTAMCDIGPLASALLALHARAAKMEAVVEAARKHYESDDDESRCALCQWTLATDVTNGCVRGNCAERPRPDRIYAPIRALLESTTLAAGDDK